MKPDAVVPNSPPTDAIEALTEQLSYLWAWEASL
jgi:hypothetical protein